MSIARKDDRYNSDLVNEISDGFNRARAARDEADPETETATGAGGDGEHTKDSPPARPSFIVTDDMRDDRRER
jgi:hypothetical protein